MQDRYCNRIGKQHSHQACLKNCARRDASCDKILTCTSNVLLANMRKSLFVTLIRGDMSNNVFRSLLEPFCNVGEVFDTVMK